MPVFFPIYQKKKKKKKRAGYTFNVGRVTAHSDVEALVGGLVLLP
jgi:hypothetical protein